MERKGIALAGNILTDNVKMVATYPQKGMLATIDSESLAVGGCVPNTAIDIKKVDADMVIKVFGRVGNDDKGKYVVNKMAEHGIDVSGVKVSESAPTSYSDVMTVMGTGERTFFHNRGANKEFRPEDVDLDALDTKMLHAGYLMLLDYFDKVNEDGTTPMSNFLKEAQNKGIKTSIDLVSESSGNFFKVTKAALPYCDYVIINEVEAGTIVGVEPRDKSGELINENIQLIAEKLMAFGVKEKVIIHCPESGFCLDKSGIYTVVPSYKLPKGYIKGSVGAGDAFCAGSLYAIYNEFADEDILRFANLVAISCLSGADSISGVLCKKDLEILEKQLIDGANA
ncbi:MAG: carbohydrate kinase family protein [Clostridia bacterium]|nr:carbohydrate kinase family protein [Clostridia bacterium]